VTQNPERPANSERRRALKWLASLSALAATALAGLPVLRTFLSPAFRHRSAAGWVRLGDTQTFAAGTPTKVDFAELVADAWVESRTPRTVWVYTDDGIRFTVYNGHCTHLGCAFRFDVDPDPRYHREGNVFHCPCHHGVFNPQTGAVLAGPPPRPLDSLETKVEAGGLFVIYQEFRVGLREKVTV
jgi:Rieske Fe-S protein